MKRRFIFLLTICTLPIVAFAQNIDEVSLKNGSVIRGNIVSLVPDGTVKINDLAGNTWVFQMNEIEKIEESAFEKSWDETSGYSFEPGIMNMTSLGVLAGSKNSYNTNNVAPFSVINSTGFLYSNGLYTGVALGIEYLDINHFPVMLDLQYLLNNKDVAPVIFVRGGYSFPSKRDDDQGYVQYSYSGGIAGSVGVGIKLKTRSNFSWDFSLLYRYMKIHRDEKYEYQTYTNYYTDIYNRLEIRIGICLGK